MNYYNGNWAVIKMPKCGSTWIRNVFHVLYGIEQHGKHDWLGDDLGVWTGNKYHAIPFSPQKIKLVLTVIRDPYDWLGSYYRFTAGTNEFKGIDTGGSFGDMLRGMEDGAVDRIYQTYTQHSTHIGRLESIQKDLSLFLGLIGAGKFACAGPALNKTNTDGFEDKDFIENRHIVGSKNPIATELYKRASEIARC